MAFKMLTDNLQKALKFYFITDDGAADFSAVKQVQTALQAGATMIQYRNKSFAARFWEEVVAVRNICKCNAVPFIVNDNLMLAKAAGADGVHLGQDDEDPALARNLLGPQAIVGLSISTFAEINQSDLTPCDYIGVGPVFQTATKKDAKAAIGLEGLKTVVQASPVPVVAIGGINQTNAESCFTQGAAGVAVISAVTRADNPLQNALQLAAACGCASRTALVSPWHDEFDLIKKLVKDAPADPYLKVPPGDDACLLKTIVNPVITTDTQKEGAHFRFQWQTPHEIGHKSVEITFSDLAASFAKPVALFVNLTLPAYITDSTVEAVYAGIQKALNKYDCVLGGGNISAGRQLSLDLFAVGRGHDTLFPSRSNALPGFGLYCTGPLGLARAGLDCLVRKDTSFKALIAGFKAPAARFDAALVLAANNVSCVIDISDGLAGDAKHIAEASGIAIEFDLTSCPFDPDLIAFCQKYLLNVEEVVLAGGEDYELLFACLPETFKKVRNDLPEAYPVGRCLPFTGDYLVNLPAGIESFQHGQK